MPSSMAWMRVASAGIGSPGLTNCRNAGGLVELASPERHRADLDDARLRRIEASRLGVNDEGIERDSAVLHC